MSKIRNFFKSMLGKTKNFFRLMCFDVTRIFRNKVLMCMLFLFPIVMSFILLSMQMDYSEYIVPMAVFSNDEEQTSKIEELFQEELEDVDFVKVESKEEGRQMLLTGKVCFYIEYDSTESELATFYYDSSSNIGGLLKSYIENFRNEYAFDKIVELIESKLPGVTMSRDHFKLIEFAEISPDVNSKVQKYLFVIEEVCFISIFIMFGLAFSISRDNETNVSRQLSYTPVSTHTYLSTKILTYVLSSVIVFSLILLMGNVVFGINYASNVFAILGMYLIFAFATASLGTLICNLKNQIASAFLSMAVILVPVLSLSMQFFNGFSIPIRVFLMLFPSTPFFLLFNYMCYNGVVLWNCVMVLAIQLIVYYTLSIVCMKLKIKKGN